MARFFLHGISPDEAVLQHADPGEWNGPDNFLNLFSNSITVRGELNDLSLSHSTPSVYARPIQFNQAMSVKDDPTALTHPLRDEVISQWRGLMGLFALSGLYNLRPTLTNLDITADAENNRFAAILLSQSQMPRNHWTNIRLLRLNGSLLGMLSPWTIVVTPAYYECPEQIPWRDPITKKFRDPLNYFLDAGAGGLDALHRIWSWLQLLRNDIQAQVIQFVSPESALVIASAITNWSNEIQRRAHLGPPVEALHRVPLNGINDVQPYSFFIQQVSV